MANIAETSGLNQTAIAQLLLRVNRCLSMNGYFLLTLRCFQNSILTGKRSEENSDINYGPVVRFIKRLDLEQNILFLDRYGLGVSPIRGILFKIEKF